MIQSPESLYKQLGTSMDKTGSIAVAQQRGEVLNQIVKDVHDWVGRSDAAEVLFIDGGEINGFLCQHLGELAGRR